jgi:ABC-2 type transport system permease protein
MNQLTGTGALVRLALRLDRVRLPVWVLIIAMLPALTAAQYAKLYPTDESIRDVSGVISNPSLVAINGQLYRASLGGLTAWKIMATSLIMVALMNIFTVIRHTRTEEETGRLELIGAGVVGRYAPLTAALLTTALANLAIALLVLLGLLGIGLPAAGSVAFALAVAVTGVLFAAVAAVGAQLTTGARSATGIAAGVLGASYLLRAAGDTGPTELTWASPIGWAMNLRSFAGERWWALGPTVAVIVACTAGAYALVGRRDLGAGLLPQRTGPATATPWLRSPITLAWRLQRGILAGWVVGMAVCGAVLGGAADGIGQAAETAKVSQQVTDMLARMGGPGGLLDAYLGAVFGLTGLVVAMYTVQVTLRLRAEESSGRVEPILATRAGRIRWALGHLTFALLGTAALLALTGLGAGLAYGARIHDIGGQVPRMLGAAMVQTPAAWVFAGLGVALFGLAPRLTILTWAGLVACLLILELGALLGLNQWIVDVSPFAHVPKLPGSAFTATPLLWLTALTAALMAAGLAGFRRRDIG